MTYKELKGQPLYWKNKDNKWFVNTEWLWFLFNTHGLPIECSVDFIKKRISNEEMSTT